jgi:hypothetical protein
LATDAPQLSQNLASPRQLATGRAEDVSRNTPKSQLKMAGPRRMLKPVLPSVPVWR